MYKNLTGMHHKWGDRMTMTINISRVSKNLNPYLRTCPSKILMNGSTVSYRRSLKPSISRFTLTFNHLLHKQAQHTVKCWNRTNFFHLWPIHINKPNKSALNTLWYIIRAETEPCTSISNQSTQIKLQKKQCIEKGIITNQNSNKNSNQKSVSHNLTTSRDL